VSTDISKTFQIYNLQKFVHRPRQAETQADTMKLIEYTYAAFHNECAKKFTFIVGQASDYQKSCADYPWFVEITLLVTVYTNTICQK
jgi:hypothetical protein